MKINNQNERDKLENAKKIVYKKGFYEGIMLGGSYKGEKVERAKERIKQDLLATNQATLFFELTGPVVCRCLTPCVVKVVQNQWFITYSNESWKQITHEALDEMKLYPEKARAQFDYVIDWLREWSCTRHEGLGTRLPWDEHWLIESLSDSTFYNAYYTIAHKLKEAPIDKINDAFFDYVFLGKGTPENWWSDYKQEFDYWYPVDIRSSAKDLIQNHLSFMLFTHAALVKKEHWPKAFSVNGYVTVNGQKMSKSLGNMIPVRVMLEQFGADASRITILNGGEGIDDCNWDTGLAVATKTKLAQFLELVTTHYGKGRDTTQAIDEWFESKLNSAIKNSTAAMEQMNFRTALQSSWFELSNTIKQYLKLTNNEPNKDLISHALSAQIKLLQPFAPHICEEAWESIGNKSLLCHAPWPTYTEAKINAAVEASQDMLELLTADIRNVQSILKLAAIKEITILISPEWKYGFVTELRAKLDETRDVRELIKHFAHHTHTQDITKLLPQLVREPGKLMVTTQAAELKTILDASKYLGKAFGATINVMRAEDSKLQKAQQAFPGKPAIILA